jgi:hypothetical protein
LKILIEEMDLMLRGRDFFDRMKIY